MYPIIPVVLAPPYRLVPPGSCLACPPLSLTLGQSPNLAVPKDANGSTSEKCYLHLAFQTPGDRQRYELTKHTSSSHTTRHGHNMVNN